MKTMKKYLALALVLCMAISVFSGLGITVAALAPMNVTARLAPSLTEEIPAANNEKAEVTMEGDVITVTVPLAELEESMSSDPGQQDKEHKWIGLGINTGIADLTEVTYNGSYTFTPADVAEAQSVGLDQDGEFILYIRADEVVSNPKTITLSADGYADKTLTIKVEKSSDYTLKLGNLEQYIDSVTPVTVETDPKDDSAKFEVEYLVPWGEWDVDARLAPELTDTAAKANNAKAKIEMTGNRIIVTAPLAELEESLSSDPGQQDKEHKWIGIGIDTGFADLTKVSYNGTPLTEADAEEAKSVGLGDGEFILYIRADELVNGTKTIRLDAEGYPTEYIRIRVVNSTKWDVSARLAPSLTDEKAAANNAKATIETYKESNWCDITVTVPLAELEESLSSAPGQGTHKWIGIGINTGFDNLTKVKYNGTPLTEADAEEAKLVGLGDGEFILYIRADEVVSSPKDITLSADGYPMESIYITVVDTGAPKWNVSARFAPELTDTAAKANNAKATIETYKGSNWCNITVTAPLAELEESLSSAPGQGTHKWIGIGINTGIADLKKVSYNGTPLTEADAEEAKLVGLGDGEFILYIRADELENDWKYVQLDADGYPTEHINITVVNSTKWDVSARLAQKLTDEKAAANNAKAKVDLEKGSNWYDITVIADVAKLEWSTSSAPGQGTHKWIGIGINTGIDNLTKVKYNGTPLTEADAEEAKLVGLGDGEFILYIRADELVDGWKYVQLDADGYPTEFISITVEDTGNNAESTQDVSVRLAPSLTDTVAAANNAKATVNQYGNRIVVETDVDSLEESLSSAPGQGTHKWIGLGINTGIADLTKVTYNGSYTFTADDVAEAKSVGLDQDGEFILYIRADELLYGTKTVTLDADGYAPTTLYITVANLVWVKDVPTEAGKYTVRAKLTESDNFAASSEYTYGTLEIIDDGRCRYTYTASGNTITETCYRHDDHTATATIVAQSAYYTGSQIENAEVKYSADWQGSRDLTINYSNNTALTTAGSLAKAWITYEGVTAEALFHITEKPTGGSAGGSAGGGASAATPTEQKPEQAPEQVPEKPAAVQAFVDIPAKVWYQDAAAYVVEKGLMTGTSATTFAPEATMTRAMLMTVLARNAGVDTNGGATWYEKSMEWAKEAGISDGTNPTGNITREQLVTMLYRAAKEPAVTGELNFTDATSVSEYAQAAMIWAVANGIVTGMGDGTVAPTATATRAQVATILMRYLELGK